MIVKLYKENPNERQVDRVVEALRSDGLIIYPTDGLYAVGCSVTSPRAVDRLRALTGKKNSTLTVVCAELSQVAEFCKLDNNAFKILRRNLPGPFTFILPASSRLPERVLGKRKTVGIRIPDNNISLEIVRSLGAPLASCSLPADTENEEYNTDPELIAEKWDGQVDIVVDGGFGGSVATSLVDLTGEEPEILREGEAEPSF